MAVRFVVHTAEGKPLAEELTFGFEQARISIGRGLAADVRIPHLTVSDLHAEVQLLGDSYAIEDRGSTNGTLVNGARLLLGRSKRLHDGDRIEVGVYTLTFHANVALSHTTTMERTSELARRLFRQSRAGTGITAPRLVVLSGSDTGRSLSIPPPPTRLLLGRAETCQLVLANDSAVANEHAELVRDLDGVLIKNLDNRYDMTVNEQRIVQRRLRDGDELLIGETRLLFEEPAEEPMDALTAEPDQPVPQAPEPAPSKGLANDASAPSVPQSAPSISPAPQRRSSFDADLLVYALAAIVIALSIVGLIALIRAE